jgi:hypothetical protein
LAVDSDWIVSLGHFFGNCMGFTRTDEARNGSLHGRILLAFSFFKFLDLRGFVRSFRRYDLLAKQSSLYAWIYPFLELALGFGWGFAGGTFSIALVTLLLMGFGAIGVIRAVRQKQAIQCACLGTVFQLPMTRVTIIEDLIMVIMSLFFLIPS